MRVTQALTISTIIYTTTITYLYYVVSIHTVLRLCPTTPMPMLYYLTPTTCTCYYLCAPYPVLWGGVDRILDLG